MTTATTLPGVEECGNGLDDDGDLAVDCMDGDCASSALCPDACGDAAGFAVLRCRLAALDLRTRASTADESFLGAVTPGFEKAMAALDASESRCAGGDRKKGRRGLKQLGKRTAKYARRVRSKSGRRAIPDALGRERLLGDAGTLRALGKGYRRVLLCPPPAP